MKVFTSRYQNKALPVATVEPVGITAYGPRFRLAYPLKWRCGILAPSKDSLDAYRDGDLTDAQYFGLYKKQLSRIGVEAIRQELVKMGQGKDVALLCFCDVSKVLCHRTSFAEWWQQMTGEKVEEL